MTKYTILLKVMKFWLKNCNNCTEKNDETFPFAPSISEPYYCNGL